MYVVWYLKLYFAHGLRTLISDNVLKFANDLKGFEVVDVYVKHLIDAPILEQVSNKMDKEVEEVKVVN